MSPIRLILVAVLTVGVVLGVGCRSRQAIEREGKWRDARDTPGPFPSDWFMTQRIWPETRFVQADYRAAEQTASRLASSAALDEPPWIAAGPTNIGGRIADIVGHPTNENLFYVAAATGGVFKTTTGGVTWIPIFDNTPGQSMGALAIDRAHPDTVYAGTGEPCSATNSYPGTGIYRTTNGGASWSLLGLGDSQYIARIVLDPANAQSIWVAAMGELYTTGGERGVYHSADGGLTWQQMLFVNDSTGASDIVLHPANAQIVYAATWQRIRNPQMRTAGGRGSGIWKSIDGGTNWTRLQDGLPAIGDSVGRIGLAISASNPLILYAIYANHPGNLSGIYRTTDGGESWNRVNDADLVATDLYAGFGWYFGNIRVRPDNPNVVFALGVDLVRSTDGGQSWDYAEWSVHVDHHALWFHPAQPTHMLLGNDGGLYRSTNNGNGWNFVPGLPINQFYAATVDFQHPERRYGGTQDNGSLQTLTGNVGDYTSILGGDGFYVLVDPTDPNVIYAEFQWGMLGKTVDGVEFFYAMDGLDYDNDRHNWCTPVVMAPEDPQRLFYGSQRLYESNDGAQTWLPISGDLTDGAHPGNLGLGSIATIGVSRVDPQVIYTGSDDGVVQVTTNGGLIWTNRSAGLPDRCITRVSPDPRIAGTVYVTVSGFRNAEQNAHLFRSTNYGATWWAISGGLPEGPLNDVIPDSLFPGRLYVASDFGAFVTPDWGAHWLPLGENLPRVPVLDLEFHEPSRQLVAATYGRSLFTLDVSQLALEQPPQITGFSPADIDTLLPPQTLTFAVTAVDPEGDSLRYLWTRNGTTVGTDSVVQLLFTEAGGDEWVAVEVADGLYSARHDWQFYVTPMDAANPPAAIAASPLLLASYPNPFNATMTVTYQLPQPGPVELTVYDITGRLVSTLLRGQRPAGFGRLSWNAPGLPSGTYILRLSSSGQHRVFKTLLIR